MKFNEILEEIKLDKQPIQTQPEEEQVIRQEDGTIIWYYTTPLGDQIQCTFNTVNKEKYLNAWQTIWKTIIKDQYDVLKDKHMIALNVSTYWMIYKKIMYGRNFIMLNGCKFIFNSENYKFPLPQQLYSNIEKYSKGTGSVIRGIYCIKENGTIIYVGSSVTDMKQRWKEHVENFKYRKQQLLNKMYTEVKDLNNLEFEILMTDEDIKNNFPYPVKYIDCFVVEYTENIFIKALKPKYNVQGIRTAFEYKNRNYTTAFNIDYIGLLEECLLDKNNEISPIGQNTLNNSVNSPSSIRVRQIKYDQLDDRIRRALK